MKGEGSDDFDPNELNEKIKEKRKIVQEKESSQNLIQKNPKTSLAIASIVFAALVIGMIATFGGIGMINGQLLGMVVLTSLTAGTAAFGAKKLYDTVKGDEDKNQLRKLEKTRDDFKRAKTEAMAKEAESQLAILKEQARDRKIVDMVKGGGWKKVDGEDKKFMGPGNFYGKRTEELTDDQMRLFEALKQSSEVSNELKKIHANVLNDSIQLLSIKLGIPQINPNNLEELKKLLNTQVTKEDGTSLAQEDEKILKEILRAGLGLDEKDNKILQGSSDFIDPQGRIKILKALNNDTLDIPTGGSNPKFKSKGDRMNKEVVDTLEELKKLVEKEKTRTKDAIGKSANRGVA